MRINRATATFLATMLVAAGLIVWVIHRVERRAGADGGVTSWQQADTPGASATADDPWLDLPDAWTEASIPFAEAIGPADGGVGNEGGVLLAVADGVVLFAGLRDGVRVVLLGHRGADGTRFESIYAPLASTPHKAGELVGRGMVIGRLGTAEPWPVVRGVPEGVERVQGGRSLLADAMESGEPQAWQTLEIGNAEKLIELMDEGGD